MTRATRVPSALGEDSAPESPLPALENRQRAVRLEMRALTLFLEQLREDFRLAPDAVAVRFVTDAEMARLNQTFRKKAGTTDVLSFPAEERRTPRELRKRLRELRGAPLGDIAISPVVARRNARRYSRSLGEELKILILHGTLHLMGYDHETDRGEMSRVESRLRRRWGLSR